jgi:hypothetical protein
MDPFAVRCGRTVGSAHLAIGGLVSLALAGCAAPAPAATSSPSSHLCAGAVLSAVFRADASTGPAGALEGSPRLSVIWPEGFRVELRPAGGVLVAADGTVVAHDGDRFTGLEVCNVIGTTVELAGLGPLPGISPIPGSSGSQ